MKYTFAAAFLVGLAGVAWGDEVRLRSGGTLRGSTREEKDTVIIDTGLGTLTLPADQVVAILPEILQECQDPVPCPVSLAPVSASQDATPAKSTKNGIQAKRPIDSTRRPPGRRSRPQPEISPGYTYLGIPPSNPPRGSQNHGYGGSALIGFTSPVAGVLVTSR